MVLGSTVLPCRPSGLVRSDAVLENLNWANPSIRNLNYIYIPVTQINPIKELDKANELLDYIKKNFKKGTFKRTASGGLAKVLANIVESKFELIQASAASIELLMFIRIKGWARVKFCNNIRTEKGEAISGTKSLRKLIELCPEIRNYVELDEEENHYYRQKAKEFYDIDKGGFEGIPVDAEIFNGRELKHVYSLDLHWAFPSALTKIIPSTEEVIRDLYSKRKEGDISIKAIGVAAIGAMCSEFTTNIGLGAKEALAKLRYKILEFHCNKLYYLVSEIEKQGGRILNLRTDSIKFITTKRLNLPGEGLGLGQWSYEFEDCTYRQFSTGKYEYIDNNGVYHPVVSGYTKLDAIKPRSEWQWGDINDPQLGEVVKAEFDWVSLKWRVK